MIQNLRNKHVGQTLAILGSGPTIRRYKEQEDVCIALNGAISLNKRIDYFFAFDTAVPDLPYYYSNKTATRCIGANIVSRDKVVFPDLPDIYRGTIRGANVDENTFLKTLPGIKGHKPASPHMYWYFKARRSPVFDPTGNYLSAAGNIAIPAFEAGIVMGFTVIHLYGIDMCVRGHFYGPDLKKPNYSSRSSAYMNALINLAQKQGITVRVSRGPKSKITEGAKLE